MANTKTTAKRKKPVSKKKSAGIVASKKASAFSRPTWKNLVVTVLLFGTVGVGFYLYETFAATLNFPFVASELVTANNCGPQPRIQTETSDNAGDLKNTTIMDIPKSQDSGCEKRSSVSVKPDLLKRATGSAMGKTVQACVLIRSSGGEGSASISLSGTTSDTAKVFTVKQTPYQKLCGNTGVLSNTNGNVVIANLGSRPLHISKVIYTYEGAISLPLPFPGDPGNPGDPGDPGDPGAPAAQLYKAACRGDIVKTELGRAQSPLREASGIIASRQHRDVYWTHNDSGDSARIFALNNGGAILGTFNLTGSGVTSRDYEDIAIGPGPVAGKTYLYVADIGDNGGSRPYISIMRFEEPMPTVGGATKTVTAQRIDLKYPGGAENSESFFVNPKNGDWYLIQKSTRHTSNVHRIAGKNLAGGTTHTLTLTSTKVGYPGEGDKPFQPIKGADMSPDGSMIAIRASNVYLYNVNDSTPEQALKTTYCKGLNYSENQGEAISFLRDNSGYITIGEGSSQPLYRFTQK